MTDRMNIVVLDGYSLNPGDLSWHGLNQEGELTVYPRTSADEVIERCVEADAILTNKVVLDAAIMNSLPRLKYIGVLATGYNVVDIAAARALDIVVTNVPAYSTDSVVQMTFAHILNMTNRIGHYAGQNRTGQWSRSEDFCYWNTPLTELSGKTIGIYGLGSIGMKVARVAMAFGMDVFAFTSKASSVLPAGIQKTTFDGLLGASDVLTLHCPLTADTRAIINSDTIARMKPGALLVNTARGPLIDEKAVAYALADGRLGGYGADVMCDEPPAADNPLLSAPNAFVTLHIAWATREARVRLMSVAVDNVRAFAAGHPVNVVNR